MAKCSNLFLASLIASHRYTWSKNLETQTILVVPLNVISHSVQNVISHSIQINIPILYLGESSVWGLAEPSVGLMSL